MLYIYNIGIFTMLPGSLFPCIQYVYHDYSSRPARIQGTGGMCGPQLGKSNDNNYNIWYDKTPGNNKQQVSALL